MDKAKVRPAVYGSDVQQLMMIFPKIADAVKRYTYLLGQTDLFRHFVDMKVRVYRVDSCVAHD